MSEFDTSNLETLNFEYTEPLPIRLNLPCLEESILSILLQKDELMKDLKVKQKNFVKYPQIFLFFTKFYEIYGHLDITIMVNKAKDKLKLLNAVEKLWNYDCYISVKRFDDYQDALIEFHEENKKLCEEKKLVNEILSACLNLSREQMDLESFKKIVNREIEE